MKTISNFKVMISPLGYPSIVKSPDGVSYQEAFKKLMTENRHRLTEKEPHYGNLIWTRS